MSWTPYFAEDYLDFDAVETFCRELAEARPAWVELEEIGRSRQDRPLLSLRIGPRDAPRPRPTMWLDAGTHASEFTGVSSLLYSVSRWIEAIDAADPSMLAWLQRFDLLLLPCISPDGYQRLHDGEPYLRSSLRPSTEGKPRTGFASRDLDGDGIVRWMRWRHPAGSFVEDEDNPLYMRPRRLGDDPAEAFFLASEGEFLQWDGRHWVHAPLEYGLDLNRNFPAHWQPFAMFGMDSGAYPGSEPESRAVIEAFSDQPHICAALTLHTYTGCVLTQPYRKDSPLPKSDLRLMEDLARQMVEPTEGYRVFRVFPEFTYDPDQNVVGVWSDTISTLFGVPGYTVELWDPFGQADQVLENPARFFIEPDQEAMGGLLEYFSSAEFGAQPWRAFEHPQLGTVEIGGIDYLRTVRNPPPSMLRRECERAHAIAETLRAALPQVHLQHELRAIDDELHQLTVTLENQGYLPSSGLAYGESLGVCPGVSVELDCGAGLELLDPDPHRSLQHLDGWGSQTLEPGSLYPQLPHRGQRASTKFLLQGQGSLTLRWIAGRAGRGELEIELPSPGVDSSDGPMS